MRPIRLHQRPMRLARLVCLTVMMALLANPVLAVVSASIGCSGQCCCCADTDPEPTATIRSSAAMTTPCCGPVESIPCRMTIGSLPDAPLALIQATQRDTLDIMHRLPGGISAAMNPVSNHLSIARIDTDAIAPASPLYLQSCRLIC